MSFQPIGLGDRVKDNVTGLEGIVVAITTWLHGCIRLAVQDEKLDKDGKPKEANYFDQTQVKLIKKGVHAPQVVGAIEAPKPETRRSTGGPRRETSGFSR